MIDSIFEYFTKAFSMGVTLSIVAAFAWGILSILLSPCHLSGIPLIIGFLAKKRVNSNSKILLLSITFSLGIFITIIIIGVITSFTGSIIGNIGRTGNLIVAFILILVGIYLMDLIKIPFSGFNLKSSDSGGYYEVFTLGLIFGLGLGPCTFAFMAPIIVIVFRMSSVNITYSLILLLAYAIGSTLVIVIAGLLFTWVQKLLNWNEKSNVLNIIKKVCGVLIVIAGIYMIYIYVL